MFLLRHLKDFPSLFHGPPRTTSALSVPRAEPGDHPHATDLPRPLSQPPHAPVRPNQAVSSVQEQQQQPFTSPSSSMTTSGLPHAAASAAAAPWPPAAHPAHGGEQPVLAQGHGTMTSYPAFPHNFLVPSIPSSLPTTASSPIPRDPQDAFHAFLNPGVPGGRAQGGSMPLGDSAGTYALPQPFTVGGGGSDGGGGKLLYPTLATLAAQAGSRQAAAVGMHASRTHAIFCTQITRPCLLPSGQARGALDHPHI